MIEEEAPYPFPPLESAEEEVEEPEEFEEGEGRERVIQVAAPRIELKLSNIHFKIELAVWADSLDEAKGAALELFHESLKAIRR